MKGSKKNPKPSSPCHIVVKMAKNKDKDITLKAAREKAESPIREIP